MRRLSSTAIAALVLLSASAAVRAEGIASRGPSTAVPGDTEMASGASGLIELNPSRTEVTTTLGYTSTTSVSVDADRGIIKGYAEFDLPSDGVFDLTDTIGSTAYGGLTSPVTFTGASDPFTVTAELRFDGSFAALVGQPTFQLAGNITASTFTAIPYTVDIYQSQAVFSLSAVTPTYTPEAILTGHASHTAGGVTTDDEAYAGATQVIVSDEADALEAIVRLSFEVDPAQSYVITSHVLGLVTAEPGASMSGTEGELLASSGIVDFSHTGVFSLYVPAGVSVSGDALLENVVVAVPEPAAYALMLAGLGVVGAFARRRR